jgi:hypothetical protein
LNFTHNKPRFEDEERKKKTEGKTKHGLVSTGESMVRVSSGREPTWPSGFESCSEAASVVAFDLDLRPGDGEEGFAVVLGRMLCTRDTCRAGRRGNKSKYETRTFFA